MVRSTFGTFSWVQFNWTVSWSWKCNYSLHHVSSSQSIPMDCWLLPKTSKIWYEISSWSRKHHIPRTFYSFMVVMDWGRTTSQKVWSMAKLAKWKKRDDLVDQTLNDGSKVYMFWMDYPYILETDSIKYDASSISYMMKGSTIKRGNGMKRVIRVTWWDYLDYIAMWTSSFTPPQFPLSFPLCLKYLEGKCNLNGHSSSIFIHSFKHFTW